MTGCRWGAIVLLLVLAGCASTGSRPEHRTQRAQALAAEAGLKPVQFSAAPFVLTGWMRIYKPHQPLVVYLEGDGKAWLDRRAPSSNPTPDDPLALKLAVLDPSPNVLYLARPCQCARMNGACSNVAYWTRKRFAPEVVAATNAAINQARDMAATQTVHLVGFSGGAALAALAAAGRDDVASIRTVAGNLDSGALHTHHKVTPLYGSLEPLNTAVFLADIPQIHYCGGRDRVVLPFISQNYQKAAGPSRCVRRQVLPSADHLNGWTEAWPSLLASPPACS